MGGIVDSVTNALGISGEAPSAARNVDFQPFDVNTGLGFAQFDDGSVTTGLAPQFSQLSDDLLSQSQGLFGRAEDFGATTDFLSEIFGPEFERQRLSQESRLQAQGLLGSTAGQQRMQDLSEAQNQSLMQNTLGAQQQFFGQGRGLLSDALGLQQQPLQFAQLGGQLGSGDLRAQEFRGSAANRAQERKGNFFSDLIGGGATVLAGVL